MTVQFFLQRVSKRHLLQHRFEAASAHRGRTSLPCLTPHTQSTNLQVLPRPPSTMCQHVAAAVRYEQQQWHIQQRCQISTHTHTHPPMHTHRNPMGSQCFIALTATCGSFTHAMPPTPTAIPATRGGTRRHTAAHSGTRQTACGNAR